MWNASEQSLVVRCTVPHAVRSLAFSPDGAHLAAGFQGGSFVVLNARQVQGTSTLVVGTRMLRFCESPYQDYVTIECV